MNAALQLRPDSAWNARQSVLEREVVRLATEQYTHKLGNGAVYVDKHGISHARHLFEKRYFDFQHWLNAFDEARYESQNNDELMNLIQSAQDDVHCMKIMRDLFDKEFVKACVNDSEGET